MALALGTNSGFVTVAPTADPAETGTTIDGSSVVTKHTSPAGSVRITSIGWYRASGTNTANWEIALYSDSAGVAATRLFVDATNSSASGGWLTTAVDWAISPSTAYWLALQMDAHSGSSSVDGAASGGAGSDVLTSQTTLNNPYGGGAVADADGMYAIYALVEIADTTDDLLADDLAAGTPTLTSAAIGQIHGLNANDVATGAPTLTSAALGQTHVLTADDIATGTPTLTAPALAEGAGTDALTADDIDAGAPTLTSAVLSQAHVLSADGIESVPTLTSPVLTVSGDQEVAVAVEEPQASNWSAPFKPKKRLSKEELDAIIREQRIALGILPPELPGQAIAEPQEIAEEVTAAVQNVVKMADIKIDRKSIYRAAYLEAEYAIEEYRALTNARKRKRTAAFLLLH